MKIKIATAIIASTLLFTSVSEIPNNFVTNNQAEAAGGALPATKKMYEKYGTKGFTTSTTITRSQLVTMANKGDKEALYSGVLRSIVTGIITFPFAPVANFTVASTSSVVMAVVTRSQSEFNAVLKKSTAKKFKLTAHWRYIRHGASKYYVISHYTVKPL